MKVKIVSLAAAVVMVGSLIVTALAPTTPVSAGTLSLSGELGLPSATTILMAGSDVTDLAVASDGATIYAVSTAGNTTLKSTNGGASWSRLTVSGMTGSPTLVAVAPGDANTVLVADTTKNIFYSMDGGVAWNLITGHTMATINAISISPFYPYSGARNITLAGTRTSDGTADIQYINVGGLVSTWTSLRMTGGWASSAMSGTANVLAIAYSPNFAGDRVMTAITTDGINSFFEIASFATQKWNAASGFTNYPVNVLSAASTGASISLAPTYLGADETLRLGFVALSTGASTGRLLRLVNTTQVNLVDGADYKSVAFNGANLVAGRNDNNDVSYSANPMASTPIVNNAPSFQRPGGVYMVKVAWAGSTVIAGTSGASSAFAVSNDNGASFNDVSLIDTTLTNMRDVAVSADGNTVFLVTDNGAQSSIWRKSAGVWQRVLNPTFSMGYIIRISPQSANNTYLFDTASTNLFYSNDMGERSWVLRSLISTPVDAAVESAQVAYALSAGGSVYKSTNGGFTWSDGVATGLGNGATITSVRTNEVLVGGTSQVAWSTDGSASSATWVRPAAQPNVGIVQATADNLTNGRIYVAGSTANGNVMRWQVGTSTVWSDIIAGNLTGSVTGLVLNDGALYAATNENAVTANVSAINRTMTPTIATSATAWNRLAAGSAFSQVTLTRTPSSLKTSAGGKLWAINDSTVDSLYSLIDTVYKTGPSVTAPADFFMVPVNTITGQAADVAFSWPRLSLSTGYRLEIAYDSAFTQLVIIPGDNATGVLTSVSDPVSVVIGPNQSGPTKYDFVPGTIFYWRVKAITPLESPWSAIRKFGISSLAPPMAIVSPAIGSANVSTNPILSWTPNPGNAQFPAGAKWYEVTMSEDPSFAIPEWSHNVFNTVYGVVDTLKYNTTYYWRVRAVYADPFVQGTKVITPAGPWLVGAFTTEAGQTPAEPPTQPQPILQGDVNGDGAVNALDITKVERIIVGLDKPTSGNTSGNTSQYVTIARPADITMFDEVIGFQAGAQTLQMTNEELVRGDWAKGPASANETSWTLQLDRWEHKKGYLAESWQMPAPGTLVYQIRQAVPYALNPGSEASRLVNGRQMTADDVVFSLRQYVTDARAYIYRANPELRSANITKTGPWQVTVQVPPEAMASAVARFNDFSSIVPPEVVSKYGDMSNWRNSVGTGPFMLTDFVPGSMANLIRNPSYWMKDPVGPGVENQLPYADGVRILIIPDLSTRLAALRVGKIDMLDNVTWQDAATLKTQAPALLSVKVEGNTAYPTYMRTDLPPFSDVRVRRAMMIATDFGAIKNGLFGGDAQLLTWPIPYVKEYAPAYLGLDDPAMPASVKQLYTYNPDLAKMLLKEAGYPNGFKTSVILPSTASVVDYYSVLKGMWAQVGIDLTLDIKDTATWTSIYASRAHPQMIYSPPAPIVVLYNSFNYSGTSNANNSYVNDSTVDQARVQMQAAVGSGDIAGADAIHKDLMKYVLDQAWAIPTPSSASYNFWWPWLKNYHGETTVGYSDLTWPTWVRIDQSMKQSMGY